MTIAWNPKVIIIQGLVRILYNLPECMTGGLCHIVTDDGNIRDCDLKFVINQCSVNPDEVDVELSKCICEIMSQLTIEQRAAALVIQEEGYKVFDETDWNCYTKVCENKIKKLIKEQIEE